MKFLVLLVAVVAAVAAVPQYEEHILKYRRDSLPHTYERVPMLRNNEWLSTPVTFTILLKQKNLEQLEDLFWKVSDPTHEMYGQYLTAEQIHEMTEASVEDRETILNWVQSVYKKYASEQDSFSVIDRRDALKITAPVVVVEELFKTNLAAFKRTRGGSKNMYIKYVGDFSVPKALDNIIDLVTGVVEFAPIPQGPQRTYATGNSTFGCNVPYTMKRMYSIDESLEASQAASQAPYSEIGNKDEGFGANDLKTFQQINNLIVAPITNIIGDDAQRYTDVDTDTEAALDVQCLTGFGNGANTSFWVMNDWMYEYANEILNTNDPPLVNSMSYGWYESQQCRIDGNCQQNDWNSEDYVQRTDIEFQKLGVMGITMLAASGDDGVESNKGCTEMRPDYPASSVYVTSVGATAVVSDGMNDPPLGSDAPEACTNPQWKCDCSTSNVEHSAMKSNNAGFDSGGGFSQWLPRPSYQATAVAAYLNSGVPLPSTDYWNNTNRGYPDVAAVGAAVLVMKNGKPIHVGGTSASCPIWGGVISLLNTERISARKSPLGFLNPLLYKMYADEPDCYNDITVGTNGGGCANLAFDATTGWDPLTGLGSPVYSKISAYVAKLK